MDLTATEANIKTLKEMVLDERKLITYVSLSKELCIHVNEGKLLLEKIRKDFKHNHPETELFVSIIISGIMDNNSAFTTVCPEADVDSIRSTFKTVFYEHIYSISLGLTCVDNVAFTALNKFEDLTLCTGFIKANSCVKRCHDEIHNLKTNSQNIINKSKLSIIQKTKEKANEHNNENDIKKVNETKSVPIVKNDIPSPKKDKSIMDKTPVRKNGKANSIVGFFNKVPHKPIQSLQNIELLDVAKIKKEDNIKVEATDTNIITNIEAPTSSETKLISKTNINLVLTEIKKKAKVDKKRKRVLHVSDSESGDEENDPFTDTVAIDHESEDEIPPTPTVNTVKITAGMVNPKKKRKIVDKTYTDEDGYILTKKEEVYESCSEDEQEVDLKENIHHVKENVKKLRENTENVKEKTKVSPKTKDKSLKKKISPPQKGKQASIKNFFSKKV